MEIIGVDGCRGGWVLAIRGDDERRVRFYVVDSLRRVFRQARAGHATAAIDIPIGLPEYEARACDDEVRAELGERRNSVFSVPCRNAVQATSKRAARLANKRALQCSISEQGLALCKKMREVDALITPGLQDRVRETHPELVFALLNGGTAMAAHKSEHRGREERLRVLAKHGIVFDPDAERYWLGRKLVDTDDLIDAAACLLAAQRIARRKERVYPKPPAVQTDRRHLRMEIVA
jgi:predicted RNase H-like nuclease